MKHDEAKRKVEKVVEKKKEKKEKEKAVPVEHTSTFFLPKPYNKPSPTKSIDPKPIPRIDSAPDDDSRGSEDEDNEGGDGSSIVNPACLIDIETKSQSVKNSKNRGRLMHSLLNVLVQKCYIAATI